MTDHATPTPLDSGAERRGGTALNPRITKKIGVYPYNVASRSCEMQASIYVLES
jgi:hypothetical protein